MTQLGGTLSRWNWFDWHFLISSAEYLLFTVTVPLCHGVCNRQCSVSLLCMLHDLCSSQHVQFIYNIIFSPSCTQNIYIILHVHIQQMHPSLMCNVFYLCSFSIFLCLYQSLLK